MALNVLGRSKGLISGAVAVAPVTDWRFYDSAYTERYMLQPQDNPQGYESSSALHLEYPSNKLLLIHGTGDDNVHFQNSAELVRVLVRQQIGFQTMYYPNQDHHMSTDGSLLHLYTLVEAFFNQKLNGILVQ